MPLAVKRLLVLTLSLIETLRHSVDRSHTALVASGVITRGLSLRNLTARLDPDPVGVADRHHHRARPFARQMAGGKYARAARARRWRSKQRPLSTADGIWIAIALAAARLIVTGRVGLWRAVNSSPARIFPGAARRYAPPCSARPAAGNAFFVGPYAEAALSGLTSTVRDEIALYRARAGA